MFPAWAKTVVRHAGSHFASLVETMITARSCISRDHGLPPGLLLDERWKTAAPRRVTQAMHGDAQQPKSPAPMALAPVRDSAPEAPVRPVPLFATRPALEPLIGEIAARQRAVLESGRYILGPEVEAFEAEFAAFVGRRHCIGSPTAPSR